MVYESDIGFAESVCETGVPKGTCGFNPRLTPKMSYITVRTLAGMSVNAGSSPVITPNCTYSSVRRRKPQSTSLVRKRSSVRT